MSLKIIKLYDLVYFQTALFMYNYHYNNLPESFNSFFHVVRDKHDYNTRFAVGSTYSIPKFRINYGKFNIRFAGVKVWNSIEESTKKLTKSQFKVKLKNYIFQLYIKSN